MKRISGVMAAAALAAMLGVTMGAAASAKAGGIMAEHAWARATMAAVKNGAAYVTLHNHGEETDHVVAAETPVAKHAGLHGHSMKDGVMQMHPVERVEVAPGGTVVFEPGGLHIMLMQLDHPLKEGESFPLTLKLASGDSLDVTVKVKAMGAMSGGHGDHDHED
ncbi:copper chaperone PCu(A)C [Ferruginivarius sediminum]|uniref:Copper chaperone PCu(A)C n=1 Tax=Ferruginivarius sediminum TaxID=2661937 RepID=A0A369T883_9PROT|nr:copper chaperone PCu(A)C [Ferruginivarius sediminum]RDD61539.1 copper chaperone PCu(A)C [Ferruginivarius sediminum]